MRDRDLYATILGIVPPWAVVDVELDLPGDEVRVKVAFAADAPAPCPQCGKGCSRYDHRERRWRHLDTCQLKTILVAAVPRVECPEHGVHQVTVPWAEPNGNFTALFEALVIDWLKVASFSAVAGKLRMTWDEVDGIQGRAVARGLARRGPVAATRIGVDETSFQKRHEYVTVVVDLTEPRVLHVADDRKEESLGGYFESLPVEARERVEVVSMDMWKPYIAAVKKWVPEAGRKIAFDKFHVAAHLGKAVDDVRRREHRELDAQGSSPLKGTKYLWLRNPLKMTRERTMEFAPLRDSALRTARAWALKEAAMDLWHYVHHGWAQRQWKGWIGWALRSRLEPVKRVGRMVRDHLWGILNAVVLGVTNAMSESVNSKIQWVKRLACGYRNRERYRHAIYFHLGGLDLYPGTLRATHTGS